MHSKTRFVSSTDDTSFLRMASAACSAEAKSRSWAGAPEKAVVIASSCLRAPSSEIFKSGSALAAIASGKVARKSRLSIAKSYLAIMKGATELDSPHRNSDHHLAQLVGGEK